MTIDHAHAGSFERTPEERYRPFLLSPVPGAELVDGAPAVSEDWTAELDLITAVQFARAALRGRQLKVLVLYGSLRER
jgi:hypothetical protein